MFFKNHKQRSKILVSFALILNAGIKRCLPLVSMPLVNVFICIALLCLSPNGLVHGGLHELIYMDLSRSHSCILNSER